MPDISSTQFVLLILFGYLTLILCVGIIAGALQNRPRKKD